MALKSGSPPDMEDCYLWVALKSGPLEGTLRKKNIKTKSRPTTELLRKEPWKGICIISRNPKFSVVKAAVGFNLT